MEKREVREILNSGVEPKGNNLKRLIDYYEREVGIIVCRNCAGDINNVIRTLKEMTESTKYSLKKDKAIYKMRRGSVNTISNKNINDELAEAFLTINSDRIRLFSKYDEEFYNNLVAKPTQEVEEVVEEDDLENLKLKDLREMYPEIKATSKAQFIEKLMEDYESNK